jgi:anti-sigma regulatory factor (Ser/Thr protein kinase)
VQRWDREVGSGSCTWDQAAVLPHTVAAPGLARRYLRSIADGWPPQLFDAVVLLTSELVTNAVVHGQGPVHLLVHNDGDLVRVEVSDAAPGELSPTPAAPPDGQESGRGLLIVGAVAHRWGCQPRRTPPGKTVWFEMRHDTPRI